MTVVFYAEISPLSNDTIFDAYFNKLPGFRRDKIEKLRFRKSKNLSLGAWIVLERALKEFGCEPTYAGFEYTKKGKPFLKKRPDLHISLSHSESIAMCAVSDINVGVDVEYISRFKEGVCRRFFKKKECSYIFAPKDPDAQNDRFFRMWVLKESFVKLTGDGIGGFGDFEIDAADGEIRVHHKNKIGSCFFYEPEIPMYKTAVCVSEADNIRFERINIIKGLLD